jgi:hypothetical protein
MNDVMKFKEGEGLELTLKQWGVWGLVVSIGGYRWVSGFFKGLSVDRKS